MKILSELKKVKTSVWVSIVVLLVLGSCLIFFNSYIKTAAVSAYKWFTGLIYPPKAETRIIEDNLLLDEYTGIPAEAGNIRALAITVPEQDIREDTFGMSYEDYAVSQLNVQLQYAVEYGYSHVLYRTSIYGRKDFDVMKYIKEQTAGLGLKLIMETDVLLLHEANSESTFSSDYAPVYETIEKNFWQRLLYPGREPERVLISGIDPSWVYIADDGSKRLNPSYEGARDFVSEQLDAALTEYHPDCFIMDTPKVIVKSLDETENLSKFPNYTRAQLHLRSTQLQTIDVSKLIRDKYPDTIIGLHADRVWRASAADVAGVQISSSYSDYDDGGADTKLWCEKGYIDFVLTDNNTPVSVSSDFLTVLNWWVNIENETGVKYVNGYTAKYIGLDGWTDYYELANQYDMAVKNNCAAGVFSDYDSLCEHNQESALLYMVFANTIDFDISGEELNITSPADNLVTDVPSVAISGTCDNNFPIYINGETVSPTDQGIFALDMKLEPGKNKINIEHKGKTVQLTVTYNITVLKDITPEGTISVMGGNMIEYSVTARKGAAVTGTLYGETVTFKEEGVAQEDSTDDSVFARFCGRFTAPESKEEPYSIGKAKVTASYGGFTKSLTGAAVTVEPKPKTAGNVAVIKKKSAETFRAEPANSDTSLPQYYWLPKGTEDIITGESVYVSGSTTKKYYTLQCGLRVYQDDVDLREGDLPVNKTSSVTVVDSGKYTYITFANSQKIPYKINLNGLYSGGNDATAASVSNLKSVDIILTHTLTTADVSDSGSSKLMKFASSAANENETVTYSFKLNSGCGIYGFTSYYDGNESLVIRFRNPIKASGGRLDGIRICLDAGHGGTDQGATGFNNVHEADENLKIALLLKSEFESRGATVYITRTNNMSYTDGTPITSANLRTPRIDLISSLEPDLLISVHHNWYSSSSSSGTEALYFYGFNQALAQTVANAMSNVSGMDNRGGKYQNVFVYRNHEFMSILLECGFLSNASDFGWLTGKGNSNVLAKAIADAVVRYFS